MDPVFKNPYAEEGSCGEMQCPFSSSSSLRELSVFQDAVPLERSGPEVNHVDLGQALFNLAIQEVAVAKTETSSVSLGATRTILLSPKVFSILDSSELQEAFLEAALDLIKLYVKRSADSPIQSYLMEQTILLCQQSIKVNNLLGSSRKAKQIYAMYVNVMFYKCYTQPEKDICLLAETISNCYLAIDQTRETDPLQAYLWQLLIMTFRLRGWPEDCDRITHALEQGINACDKAILPEDHPNIQKALFDFEKVKYFYRQEVGKLGLNISYKDPSF